MTCSIWPGSARTRPASGASTAARIGGEDDVFSDEASQQLLDVLHQSVEIDDLGLEDLATAEREQLLGQGRGPVRRAVDLIHVLAPGVIGRQIGEEQVGVSADGGEDVVEVVGDAAGEPADRLHLLRLDDLLLETAPLGGVAVVVDNGGDDRVVEEVGEDALEVAPGAVLVPHARRHIDAAAGVGHRFREPSHHRVAVLRVDKVKGIEPYKFVQLVAENAGRSRAAVKDGAVGPEQRDGIPAMLDERAKPLLVGAQRRLGGDALGPALPHLQGAPHRRREAHQMRLEDVVGGTRLDARRGRFLVDAARHHDQGDKGRLAAEDLEGRHAAEPGNGVVGEDDVGHKVSQLAAEVRFRVDAAGAAGDLGPL